MNAEGRGLTAPKPILFHPTRHEKSMIKERAILQSAERNYPNGQSTWKSGLASEGREGLGRSEAGPYVGMMAEHAVCETINRRVRRKVANLDMESRQRGDGGKDISVFGLSIQVKCLQYGSGFNLVRRMDEEFRPDPIASDIYVFCVYPKEFHGNQKEHIKILGWIWTKDTFEYPIVPAVKGFHYNVEIPDWDLLPVVQMIHEIKRRGGLL